MANTKRTSKNQKSPKAASIALRKSVRTSYKRNLKQMEDKLLRYLLEPNHPKGGHKAELFNGIGYTKSNWRALLKQLKYDCLSPNRVQGNV